MQPPSDLPEFLATVSRTSKPSEALRTGVTSIAETFDAEVAAVVRDGRVLSSTGFPRAGVPVAQLVDIAGRSRGGLEIPGVGEAEATVVEAHGSGFVIVIARHEDPLDATELAYAQAMARILALAVELLDKIAENERLVRHHRDHEALLEAILRVQRLISQRTPIDTILQAITSEAANLFVADLAGIWLSSPSGAVRRALAMGRAETVPLVDAIPEQQLADLGRRAAEGELAVPGRIDLECETRTDLQAHVVGAAVYDDGVLLGGFWVLGFDRAGPTAELDPAAVETFASQASIALTDASTMDELHHAFHDTLTGLPNRALFQDRFEQAISRGSRNDTTTALLFVDLDRFKAINDTFGHAAGDQVLREVAAQLANGGRAHDSVARLGGDEFAVLLEDTSAETARKIADRLLDRIEAVGQEASPFGSCSASIGIATTEPGCATTDELLRRADIAMYAAKAAGRSDVVVYETRMGTSRLDNNAMAEALAGALERDEFVVHYQPIVSLQTREVTGAEALVRWLDPERGLLSPAEFIQAAEDTGMIVPIGRRVLQIACRDAARWRRTIPAASEFKLSANLSGRQLQSETIGSDIRAVLEDSGLDASALTLEVTESIFVDDADAAGERLRALKELGISLAIDDFGTGFSSLSYIHHYPFDVLKIDRTFVAGLGTTTNGGALVKTLLALAQQLSMSAVAEGVETPVELAQLRALRCSHGQGYFFSRPLDVEGFEQHMAAAGEPATYSGAR